MSIEQLVSGPGLGPGLEPALDELVDVAWWRPGEAQLREPVRALSTAAWVRHATRCTPGRAAADVALAGDLYRADTPTDA
jgi:hypothetical protein